MDKRVRYARSESRGFRYDTPEFTAEYRQALIDWLVAWRPKIYTTLNFNYNPSLVRVESNMRTFCAAIDRQLIGGSWQYDRRRTDLWVFVERKNGKLHLHAVGHLPRPARDMSTRRLGAMFERTWKTIVPQGSTDLQRIDRTPEYLVDYITKQLPQPGRIEEYFSTRQFWPTKLRRHNKRY